MIDERQKRIIEALGLNVSDFEPDEDSNTRINDLTDAVLELSEIVGGMVE